MENINITAILEIDKENLQFVVTEFKKLQTHTLNQIGVLKYEAFLNDNVLIVNEKYTNQDALDQHNNDEIFKQFFASCGKFIKPQIFKYLDESKI